MNVSPQDQAIATLNHLLLVANQLNVLKADIDATAAQWTNFSIANKVNAFPTAPLLGSGAYGTADNSPVVSNPVDTRVVNTLLVGLSPNNFAGLLTVLQGVSTAIGGGSVSANGAAVQLLALAKTV